MDGNDASVPASLERFSFGDSGHVTVEQLRVLRSLDELLARNLTHALSAWLRTGVSVTAEAQAQQTFREFLEGVERCYQMPVHLPQVHATGLLAWPLPMAAHIIELLLGGSGSAPGEVRDLTDIEEEIFQAVLDVLLREWNAVWQQLGVQLKQAERSRNGSERQLLTPAERVFVFRLRMSIEQTAGDVTLCVAAPVLASVMRRMSLMQAPGRAQSEADVERLVQSLKQARVRAGLCFPPVRLKASRLAELQPGTTLILPLPSNVPAEFRLSEVPVAGAAPVRVGAWRAAKITGWSEVAASQASLALPSASSQEGPKHG